MKFLNYIILLLSINLCYQSSAQSTQELYSLPGLTFVVDNFDDTGFFTDGSIYYMGDTIHQDTLYHRYETKNRSMIYLYVDEYKVYSKSLTSDYEKLLFDFGMEVGDTLLFFFDEVFLLESKGNIQLEDGLDRLQLNFIRPDFPNVKRRIIEGVGHELYGMFTHPYTFSDLQCITSDASDIFISEDFSFDDCFDRSCPGIEAKFQIEGDKEDLIMSYDCHNFESISLTFGDGIYHNEFMDTYTYQEPGCYKIELEIFNECGESSHYTEFYNYCEDPKWQKQSDISLQNIQFLNSEIGYGRAWEKVYKTVDGGSNWTVIPLPETEEEYRPYSIYFADEDNGLVTSSSKEDKLLIMITSDGGLTWKGIFEENYGFVDAVFDDEGNIFAVNYFSRVFRSYDKGNSWTELNLPNAWVHEDFQVLDNGVLILANRKNDFYDFPSFLYISNDNGDSWKKRDMTFDTEISSVHFFDEFHGLVGMEGDIYETFDKGLTWQNTFSIKERGTIENLNFSNENDGIMTINNRFYITSDGGQTWDVEYCQNTASIRDVFLIEDQIYSCMNEGYYKRIPDTDFDCEAINNLETESESTFEIAPNPTFGQFQIWSNLIGDYNLEIRNTNGVLVKKARASNQEPIDISNLSSGLYFVLVRKDSLLEIFKIVKN